MNRLILLLLLLSIFSTVVRGQNTHTIKIFLLSTTNDKLISDKGNVRLLMTGPLFGQGIIHTPNAGMVILSNIPVGSTIKFFIDSDQFYTTEERSFTVSSNPGDNSLQVKLKPLEEGNFIIRGKILDKDNPSKNLNKIPIEINLLNNDSTIFVKSNQLGTFKLIIPNGNKFIGTDYAITINQPDYDSFSAKGTIKNNRINIIDEIRLNKKVNKVTYNIKFIGLNYKLKSSSIFSEDFIIHELADEAGVYQLISISDSSTLKESFVLKILDRKKKPHLILIKKQSLRKDITNTINLENAVGLCLPKLSLSATPAYSTILNNNVNSSSSFKLDIGVSKLFNVYKNTFYISSFTQVISPTFKITNAYVTLPGILNEARYEYSFSRPIGVELGFFPKSPFTHDNGLFVSTNAAWNIQKMTDNSINSSVIDDAQNFEFLSLGLKTGVAKELINKFIISAQFEANYYMLRKYQYKFNYFGQADVAIEKENTVNCMIGVSIQYNLF